MPRRMRDPQFRREQHEHLRDPHIAPINALVDELRREKGQWAPYVAPLYGGVHARILSVLRDPGPRTTDDEQGSGLLCVENDDPTAARVLGLLEGARIPLSELVPWNAYPWYINAAPTTAQLNEGTDPLYRLIQLLPRLRVIMLHGGDAKKAWRLALRSHPDLEGRNLEVIGTYHPSPQAFRHPDPAVREKRRKDLTDAFSRADTSLRALS